MWLYILYGIAGLIVVGIVALRPKLFWPMLIVIAVGTAGLFIPQLTLPLVDEYLLGCLLLGSLLAISIGAIRFRKSPEDTWDKLHIWIFFLFIAYMIIQSLRGLLLWEDLRLSRWIIYYLMLGILAFIISRGNLPVPNTKKMSLMILGSALIYLTTYLAHGFFSELVRGISRWDLQGIEWSGPGYAVFPLVIAMPAAIFLFKYGAPRQRWLGWALIIIALIVGYFYDSRAAWITVLAFLVVSPTRLRFRQIILWLLIFGVLIFFLYGYFTNLLQILVKSAFLQAPSEVGRLMHAQAAFSAVSANLTTLFFGYGIHSHHFVIAPYLHAVGYALWAAYLRVSGFAGLLIDIGFFGMLLFGMNFLFVARKILIQKKSPGRVVLLVALLLTLFYPIISKVEDIALFFLLIMPSGLLIQLSRYKREEGFIKKEKLPESGFSNPTSNNFNNKKLL